MSVVRWPHRSQYDFIEGFARYMRDALPNASFIAFTGTPIEKATPILVLCSAITSASMISSAPSLMAPPCPSTTRAVWQSLS